MDDWLALIGLSLTDAPERFGANIQATKCLQCGSDENIKKTIARIDKFYPHPKIQILFCSSIAHKTSTFLGYI